MRRCTVSTIIVTLVAAIAIPAASAQTAHNYRRQAHHFQRLAALKAYQLRASRAREAELTARVAALTAQATGLQAALTQRTQERDAARAQATALQSRLDAIPTPLEAAEQYVEREVWAAKLTDTTRPAGEIASLAAMAYVESHVSFFQRAWRLNHGLSVPGDTPGYPVTANSIFGAQAGQCAAHAFAFASLMRYLGYPVRSVSFYYATGGHTSTEVYYDGAWHYFDPSFDLYWTDASGNVLDITTARTAGGTERKADALLFNVIENLKDAGGGGLSDSWFETDPDTSVVLGENRLGG